MPDKKKTTMASSTNGQRTQSNGDQQTIKPPRPTEKPGYMVIREMTDKKREAEKKPVQNGHH
jgi:hypothetical protein